MNDKKTRSVPPRGSGRRRHSALWFAIALLALPLSAAQAQSILENNPTVPQRQPVQGTDSNAASRIAAEDTVEVSVIGHPELTRTLQIQADGMVTLPYVGQVRLGGLTMEEAAARIASGLSRYYTRPQVGVQVVKRRERSVGALGAVRIVGKRVMQENWRILDLLLDSGGITAEQPEWVTATLIRGGGTEQITVDIPRLLSGDATENRSLVDGDVLLVRAAPPAETQVMVLGEVVRPGGVQAPRDGSPVAALLAAGGATERAALSKASIVRRGQNISLDLRGPLSTGNLEGVPPLEPGDTLVIPLNRSAFAVFGAVARPGQLAYPEDGSISITNALAMAGGQTPDADLKKAWLVRPGKDGKEPEQKPLDLEAVLKTGQAPKDLTVQAGDMLYIPNRRMSSKMGVRDVLGMLPLVGLFMR